MRLVIDKFKISVENDGYTLEKNVKRENAIIEAFEPQDYSVEVIMGRIYLDLFNGRGVYKTVFPEVHVVPGVITEADECYNMSVSGLWHKVIKSLKDAGLVKAEIESWQNDWQVTMYGNITIF